jgi:hypothetical protein
MSLQYEPTYSALIISIPKYILHLITETGTDKVRNEIETKRNEINENETKRNETKSTKWKRNETKPTKKTDMKKMEGKK